MELLQTTLCYLEKDGAYLMLHRVKKKNDVNHDKWVASAASLNRERTRRPAPCARCARRPA